MFSCILLESDKFITFVFTALAVFLLWAEELEGGRNRFRHWKDMELLCLQSTSVLLPVQHVNTSLPLSAVTYWSDPKSSFCVKASFFLLLILLGSDHSDLNCPVKIAWGQTELETNTENHDYPRSEIEILAYTAHTAYTTSINIMRTVKYLLEHGASVGAQLDAKYLMDIL